MKLQLAALSLFLAATTIVQAQVDDSGMTEGIQDSVYAFGTNNCQSDANAQDEDIMIDCFDPKTAKKPFTSHQALEYADQVPTMFKSFHGSDAGLNACVYSFNSTTKTVADKDFKKALAAIPVRSSKCSSVPTIHKFNFLNKKQKIKSLKRSTSTALSSKTKQAPKYTGDIHRYVCLLEDKCRATMH